MIIKQRGHVVISDKFQACGAWSKTSFLLKLSFTKKENTGRESDGMLHSSEGNNVGT